MTLASKPVAVAALLLATATFAGSQTPSPSGGTVEKIKVHGRALEGNLEGDSPDRDVMVYLPPSYKTTPNRRYPVVYLLHGFTDDTDHWWGVVPHFVSVPAAMNKALASGATKEMILVMPNAFTRYFGSMYSSSVTTGDWERFIARELVAYIDAHYRTLAVVDSRGLAGHSMGGYGTIRIGMKHPEVFSSIYAMSSCCLSPTLGFDTERGKKAEAVKGPDEVQGLDFMMKATLASAAAWSPNPSNPPLYLDVPTKDGAPRPEVLAKWIANAPLTTLDQYVINLKSLKGLALDVGTKDFLVNDSKALDARLTAYGVPHTFETYDGDHINRVAERLETRVFAFFSKQLRFE
jgi:enterochelin esterase-like enzyme